MRHLLLVGGAAGTGKSTVAQEIASQLGAGWLQLDTLWIAMRDAAPPGSEERGRLDIDHRVRLGDASAEELLPHHILASEAVCAALPQALAFELQAHPTLVADGAWVLPRFVSGLALDHVRISAVFLHQTERVEVERAMSSRRSATIGAPWHSKSSQLAWLYGNWLADQTRETGLPLMASRPYDTAAERILAVLGPGPRAPRREP
jgi:2-phosphoglycerate kinase